MKKWLCLLLPMLMLFSIGCGKEESSKKEKSPATTAVKAALTKDDAIAAAEAYWKVKSGEIDAKSGNRVSVVITEFPGEDNLYFRAVLRHIVEVEGEDPHSSLQGEEIAAGGLVQVDEVRVHSVTGKVTPVNKK